MPIKCEWVGKYVGQIRGIPGERKPSIQIDIPRYCNELDMHRMEIWDYKPGLRNDFGETIAQDTD